MRPLPLMTGLNLLGAVLGVVNTLVVARIFGTSREIEVFFAASALLVSLGFLAHPAHQGEITLPIYHRIRERAGRESAQVAVSVLVNWTALLGGGLCLLLWIASPLLMELLVPGFGAADRDLAVTMFRLLVPLIAIQMALSLFQTLANAERRFGRPEAVAVSAQLLSLLTILGLWTLLGTWVMVLSVWVVQVVQVAGMLAIIRGGGYRHTLKLRHPELSFRALAGQVSHALAYVGAAQVYVVALNAGISLLPQGMYAVFGYVMKLFTKANSILLRPVAVVFLTQVSEAMAAGVRNVRALAHTALARSLAIWMALFVAVLVVGRRSLILLWGRGEVGPADIEFGWWLLLTVVLLLPLSALTQIARKTVMALGRVREQYIATGAVQLLSGLLAFVLIPREGLAGVVAVLVANVGGAALAPMVILIRARPEITFFYPMSSLWRWGVAGACGVAAGLAADRLPLLGAVPEGLLAFAAVVACEVAVSVSVTLGVARLLGEPTAVAAGQLLFARRPQRG